MPRKKRKIKNKRENKVPEWKFFYLAHGKVPPGFDGNPFEGLAFWRSDEIKELWKMIPEEEKENYPYGFGCFGK